ncbi:ABC transporter, ATP-binding protein and permease component [Bacillus thuringiensis serovar huazhongensis BGSC 4BD1]|nr:ABC transporter, ATP-binding protein and permease component [Bacillus thuringiensis serovar huazhongensis BGSC 4BD1]
MKIGRDKFKMAAIIPLHTAAITNIFSCRNGNNILLYSVMTFPPFL